jgi:hypothetical protein
MTVGEIRTPARTAVIPSTEGLGCEGPPRSRFGLAARPWPAKPLLTRGSTSGSENERWRYLWGGIISQPHICGSSNKSRSTTAHSFTAVPNLWQRLRQVLGRGGWRAVHVGVLKFDFLNEQTTRHWVSEDCPGRSLPGEENSERIPPRG